MKQRSRHQRGMDLALAAFPEVLRGDGRFPHGGSKIPPGKCFRGFLAAKPLLRNHQIHFYNIYGLTPHIIDLIN